MVALTNASRRSSVWLLAPFGVIPFGQATRKPPVYAALDSLELACSVNLIYQPDGLGNFIAREFTDDYQPALGLHVIGPGLYSAAVGAAGAAGAGCPLLG